MFNVFGIQYCCLLPKIKPYILNTFSTGQNVLNFAVNILAPWAYVHEQVKMIYVLLLPSFWIHIPVF